MKKAFTLAEVLITLGIIGVVAAMTMPNLIASHQKKVLETSFKKSYSSLLQALIYVEPELLPSIVGDNPQAGAGSSEFDKSYLKVTADIPGCMQIPQHVAVDGSSIGGMYNCYANWISIDTNGPKKGPNALGHDLFYFGINANGRLIPLGENIVYSYWNFSNSTYCSKNSTNTQNGVGCAKYAISNTCPDDSSKTYWECLPR